MPSLSASTSDPAGFEMDSRSPPSILIRRLPRNINEDILGSMLIFAGDLIETDFVRSPYPEDGGFATAVAHFRTHNGALEALQKLDGKPNTTKDALLIVELHSRSMGSSLERRATVDGAASRSQASSASSGGSVSGPPCRSRYGSTFQSSEKTSPPLPTPSSGGSAEFPVPESSAHFQNLFSPRSPLTNGINGMHRVSGKSMINDDSADDETGDILKDPRAYAENGRRAPSSQIPVSRFASLSLNTTSPSSGFTSTAPTSLQSPTLGNSPISLNHASPNGAAQSFARPTLPPINPADQHPPCNTLYVGNLPLDTSEDELKAIFSKQRGYKRLCFRTKNNGPMCFVEFEDIAYATKALNELYGHPLHNSVKGGIRLSFSKNPLGVRNNLVNGFGPNGVMTPQAMAPGYGNMVGGATFSSVSGPPPGLAMPPGLPGNGGYRSAAAAVGVDSIFSKPFGLQTAATSPPSEFASQLSPRTSGGVPSQLGTATYGRDMRMGYSDRMMGR
ncbi:hypothetical protein EJ03DRAFT_270092 [Teratosphaeria nubilosa]|uniref:RRM domain-containing protein n=1 Tax=Teratosphaeria nubilosa TaxID=161662 RepID=A0A6G1LCX9_9PEZI|nr:hypothetical protein EJ03DRAFT_270092 [Teratosphaeria nubilosa]